MKIQILFFSLFLSLPLLASPLHKFSPSERQKLSKNQLIIKRKDIPNKTWPELTIYTLINTNYKSAAAVFLAFDYQKNYVLNLLKSDVIKVPDATTIIVSYERENPFPLSNDHFTNIHKIKKTKNGIHVSWKSIKSKLSESIKGEAYFTDHQGQTFFQYRIQVQPRSIFANLVKGHMVDKTTTEIKALVQFIGESPKKRPDLVFKYKKILEASLNQKKAYAQLIRKLE